MMDANRREFLQAALAAGAAAALAGRARAGARLAPDPEAWRTPAGSVDPTLGAVKKAAQPLNLLMLGGTGFLGPHTVEYALARGHTVTLFNRGKTNPHLFPSLEKVRGDRNGDLAALETLVKGGRTWHGVVDTSGYFPRQIDVSCGVLKDAIAQYLFIETINVYKSNMIAGEDEDGELNLELVENGDEQDLRNYGAYKALSGLKAERLMPGRVTRVRPALISGPRDPSDRFTYWPVRLRDAVGERRRVLAPAPAHQPVQFIDGRDLARFLVTLIENRTMGAFNGIGPVEAMTMGQLLDACAAGAGTQPEVVWVDGSFIVERRVQPWMELPVWVPAEGDEKAVHQRSTAKSASAGLVTRPAKETARDTIAWWPGELERRAKRTAELLAQAKKDGKELKMADPALPRAGLAPAKEAEVLEAWAARKVAPAPG